MEPRDILGKTLLIRKDSRILPVFCYEYVDEEDAFNGLQLRPRAENDDIRSDWIVLVGSSGLKNESVAMVSKKHSFRLPEVVRVLGPVGIAIAAAAKGKREQIEARPMMFERRKLVAKEIAHKKALGLKTKGLNKEMKKLSRAIEGPGRPSNGPRPKSTLYAKINPKPYQGGKFNGK